MISKKINWFNELPEKWNSVRAYNFVNKIIGGDWGDEIDSEKKGIIVPILRVNNIDNIYFSYEDLTFRKIKISSFQEKKINPNSIIIEKSGGGEKKLVGRAGLPTNFPKNSICSNFMAKLDLNSKININFFNYVLKDLYDLNLNFPCIQQTTGIQNLNVRKYLYLNIPVPPKDEQEAIANYLDKTLNDIEKTIELKKNQIEKINEYFKSRIHEVVTKGLKSNVGLEETNVDWIGKKPKHWKIKRFKLLFNFKRGLTITKENLQDIGIPCINYGEIHSKYGFEFNPQIHDVKCVDEIYLKTNLSSLLKYGDFVFADTSEDLEGSGNFTYLNSNEKAFAGYHTIITSLETNDNPRFLAHLFNSEGFRSQIRKLVTGIKVYSITNLILKSTKVLLPPKEEQEEIANYLDKIKSDTEKLVDLLNQQINKLENYKKSILHECVTGKKRIS